MHTHSKWIKVGAVSLSVLLAGTYVGYRATKAAPVPQPASSERTFMPGPKSAEPELPAAPANQETPAHAPVQAPQVLLPGSKVDQMLPPGTKIPDTYQWTPDARSTFLPGSKDAPVQLLPETPKPRKRKVMLVGSKSSPVGIEIEVPDDEEAPKTP